MATLRETLTHPDRHDSCIKACSELVEREVGSRTGLGGAAIKTCLALARKVRPTLVEDAVRRLVGPFSDALEPFWAPSAEIQAPQERAQDFQAKLNEDPSKVANALLSVTDARIGDSSDVIRKSYEKLRKGAQSQVERSVPEMARTLGSVLS